MLWEAAAGRNVGLKIMMISNDNVSATLSNTEKIGGIRRGNKIEFEFMKKATWAY